MRRVQRVGDLNGQVKQFTKLEGRALDAVLEGLALEQFHCDEGFPFEFIDVVNRADVRMVERRRRSSLALEALERHRVAGKLSREELERDAAAQAQVFGAVDHTHAAAAQLLQHFIVRDGLTDHEGLENSVVQQRLQSGARSSGK